MTNVFFNYLIANKLNLLKKIIKKYIVKSGIEKGTKIANFLKVRDEMSQLKCRGTKITYLKK